MSEYTVHLDELFRGPADLLLQLVKDEEVDVQRVPLTKVCDGFLRHLQSLPKSDIEGAAEFLVVAATLLWLKSNAILPHETIDLEEELQGKDDLLTRLLEYRRFRDAGRRLGALAEERERRFERGGREPAPAGEEAEVDLEDLSSWNLLEQFARLMKETLFDKPHTFKGEGKPVEEYAREIVEKLRALRSAGFSALFGEIRKREDVIGYFVALLELVKQGAVAVEQIGAVDEIELVLKEEGLATLDLKWFQKDKGESSNG